jgi:hypothetical protein
MIEASEDAEVEEVPGEVCSVRIVVPCAMQAYSNCVGADEVEAMASEPNRRKRRR